MPQFHCRNFDRVIERLYARIMKPLRSRFNDPVSSFVLILTVAT